MEKMSVIFFKRTGEIYTVVLGDEGLKIFGNNEEDFKSMLDVLILTKDDDILWNSNIFKVDTEAKELVLNNIQMYEIFKNTQKVRGGKNGKKRN